MKNFLIVALWALVAVSSVDALPRLPSTGSSEPNASNVKRQNFSTVPPFDAQSQYVSTSGIHEVSSLEGYEARRH